MGGLLESTNTHGFKNLNLTILVQKFENKLAITLNLHILYILLT